ncbi:MAG TPA: CHAD domain-containing protein [Caballeronia sp.]|nr:CHAD domain-containing protein [Caballeronia sp.]
MEEPRVAIVRSYRPSHGFANARAVTARRVRLTKRMSVEEAFRATVLECLAQVGGNAPAIRARDSRGIHQIRVGLRRLQMALKSFGEYADTPALKTLGKRGRSLANVFGPARDLDVFADELLPRLDLKFSGHESFIALQLALRHARGEAWDDALAEILNPEFGAFLNDVAAVAETLPHNDTRIGKFSGLALDELYSQVRKRRKRAHRVYDARTHKLRIALKKLRYAAEFFAPLYSQKRAAKYIRTMKLLLNELGDTNDAHGVGELMRRLGDAPELSFAKGAIAGWYAAKEKRLATRALKSWRKFKRLKPFWT